MANCFPSSTYLSFAIIFRKCWYDFLDYFSRFPNSCCNFPTWHSTGIFTSKRIPVDGINLEEPQASEQVSKNREEIESSLKLGMHKQTTLKITFRKIQGSFSRALLVGKPATHAEKHV